MILDAWAWYTGTTQRDGTLQYCINACPTLFPGISPPTAAALLELGSPRGSVRKGRAGQPCGRYLTRLAQGPGHRQLWYTRCTTVSEPFCTWQDTVRVTV